VEKFKKNIHTVVNNIITTMSLNSSFENSINVMKMNNSKDYSELDWGCISQYKYLSEKFMEEHSDKLSWKCISNHQKLREEFIEKHLDKLHLDIILRQKGIRGLSEAFKQKHILDLEIIPRKNGDNKNRRVVKLPKQWRSKSEDNLIPEKPVKTFERFESLQRVKTYSNLPLEIPLIPTPVTSIVKPFDYQTPNQYNYLKEDYQNSVKTENQYDFLNYDYSLVGKKILDTYCAEDYFKSKFF
jgi:hypothetical protein